MKELKQIIIKHFDSKGQNFKKGLKREFQKEQTDVSNGRIYVYRDILIYEIFKELTENQDVVFDEIENPLNFIETTLFEYLNS
tara:strand:+ start:285 stop:533 length:249 start_codon:yes stop_codon:yes gene_type:complete